MEKGGDGENKDPPPHPKKLKYLTTASILFGNITFGCAFNFFGPALEDLKNKFDTSIEGISLVFTIMFISYCVGALSCGVIYNFMNRQLAVSICLGCVALALYATPHVPTKTVFFILGAFLGFFSGAYDTAQMVWIMELWQGEAGPYIQAQCFCYALGTNIPPLLIPPFLSSDSNPESNIVIPFTIGGAFITLAGFYQIFLFIFFRYYKPAFVVDLYSPKGDYDKRPSLDKGSVNQFTSQNFESNETLEKPTHSTIKHRSLLTFKDIHWYKVKLIALTAIFLASYVGMEMCTMQFVPVFGKYSDLQLSEKDSAVVLFGVTSAFAVGRLVGIFVILKVIPQYLLVANLLITLCGNLVILIWGSGNLTMLWVGCATIGTGYSIIYPSFCAYIEPHLMFTDAIGAFIVVCSSGIASLYPVVVGRAIEDNPVVLTYTNFFSISICVITLILASKLTYGNHKRV